MTDTKLCINCKYYRPYAGGASALDPAEYSTCGAVVMEDNTGLTRIDGRALVIKYKYCDGLRRDGGQCGPDAKLFESAGTDDGSALSPFQASLPTAASE